MATDAGTPTKNVDMDVQIPTAVRRAAERADQLAAEANTEARRAAGEEEAPATSVVETPAPTEQSAGQPAGQPAPTEPAPAPAPTEPVRDADYWQRRYRSIQGKYDNEVPSLAAQLRAAQSRATELEGTVADLHARLRATPKAKPAPDVSEEDKQTYGEDFIEKVRAWTGGAGQKETDPEEIAQLKAQMQQLQQRTVQTQQQSVQESVKTYLNTNMPGWESINTEADFYDGWLLQPDPFSGVRRMDLLQQAYTSGDGPRTVQFFKAYLAEHTATRPAEITPSHTPAGAGTVPLAELAAPGRGRPGTPGAQPEKPFFTPEQVEAFYRNVTRGAYRGRDAEKARDEAQIHEAAAEGRIRRR